MSSDLKVTNIKHASSSSNNLVLASDGSATINQINSSTVFPSGHIVQTVGNATLSNYSNSDVTGTSKVGVVDITGQITITSGNHVLIYCQIFVYAINNTNAYGHVSICQGTRASLGTVLSTVHFGSSSGDVYGPISLWAYDSSPADATTPDYCMAIGCGSGNTQKVKPDVFHSEAVKCFLFEVKQ